MIITQFALQIGYRVKDYMLKLLKDNAHFKTLQNLSGALSRKSNWLCEYNILKTVIFRKSFRIDITCCLYLQNIFKHEFSLTNG